MASSTYSALQWLRPQSLRRHIWVFLFWRLRLGTMWATPPAKVFPSHQAIPETLSVQAIPLFCGFKAKPKGTPFGGSPKNDIPISSLTAVWLDVEHFPSDRHGHGTHQQLHSLRNMVLQDLSVRLHVGLLASYQARGSIPSPRWIFGPGPNQIVTNHCRRE